MDPLLFSARRLLSPWQRTVQGKSRRRGLSTFSALKPRPSSRPSSTQQEDTATSTLLLKTQETQEYFKGAVIAVCCSDVASVRIPSCIDSNQAATTAAPRPAFDEPVCKNKTCKDYAECLVAETCTSPDSCILEPLCMKREPRSDAEKGCQVGEPLIQEAFHGYQYYSCWKGEHCPKGFICGPQNVCCRPPGPDVKSGACPPMYWEFEPCENKCKSDADCPGDHKCCQTSPSCPKKECTFPDTGSLGHMCSYKICSYKYDCRLSIRRSCLRKLDMHFPPGLLRKFLEGR